MLFPLLSEGEGETGPCFQFTGFCSKPCQTSKANTDGSCPETKPPQGPLRFSRPGRGRGGENPANLTAKWEPQVPQIKGNKPNSQTSWLKQGLFCFLNFPATGMVFNPATEYNQCHLECSADAIISYSVPFPLHLPHNYGEFRVGMFYDASFQAHDNAEGRVI